MNGEDEVDNHLRHRVDEFTGNGLFQKVKDKSNIAIVGFTTDDEVFGCFYSVAVTAQDRCSAQTFALSFESHGRCLTPKMFVLKMELRLNEKANVCGSSRTTTGSLSVLIGVMAASTFRTRSRMGGS